MATVVNIFKQKKFNSPVVLMGLPGIGLVGKIVVDYLIKEMKPEKIGEIVSDSFPPSVYTKKGVLDLIKDDIYYLDAGKNEFIIVAGPVQPNLEPAIGSSNQHYEFAEKLVQFFIQAHAKKVITLAGINIGEHRLMKEPNVVGAATTEKVLEDCKKHGVKADQPEGLISGAAGMVLGFAKLHNLDGVCLMGETNARLVYGDPGAAKALLELLMKMYGFKVKMDRIEHEAQEIEKAFHKLSETMEEGQSIEDSKKHTPSYVR